MVHSLEKIESHLVSIIAISLSEVKRTWSKELFDVDLIRLRALDLVREIDSESEDSEV